MPQAIKQSAIGVTLELTDPPSSYLPGNTLTGKVVWKSQQIGFLRLRLFGRVKTKIERKHTIRGRAILFDLTDVLYNGKPSQELQTLPFSIAIPATIQENVKAIGDRMKIGIKDEWRDSADFLSTAQSTGNLHLPFSYYYAAADMGVSAEAFVEYVIQVETAVSEQASKNETSLEITSIPLVIRMPQIPRPATPKLMARSLPRTIVAHSTDVDFDRSKITFRQKMRKTFRPASNPRYSFDIRVDLPMSIQLDDPTSFPFKVSIFPDLRPERTNICPDGDTAKLPQVKVTSLKLYLQSTTLVRCPASWMDDESDKIHEYKWEFPKAFNYLVPVGGIRDPERSALSYQHAVQAPTPSSALDSIDLGTLLGLRLTPLKTEAQGEFSKQLVRPVWPSFKTFSINVSYEIKYEIGLECLGEKDTVSNLNYAKSRVTILPPEHSQQSEMKTKTGDFDPVPLAMTAGDIAWTIVQNVLF